MTMASLSPTTSTMTRTTTSFKYAEGVGQFQPRVASTLGPKNPQRSNAESVG
jgi:hypothetical protein